MLTSYWPAHRQSPRHMHVQRWDLAWIRTGNHPDRRQTRYHCASELAINIKSIHYYMVLGEFQYVVFGLSKTDLQFFSFWSVVPPPLTPPHPWPRELRQILITLLSISSSSIERFDSIKLNGRRTNCKLNLKD